MYILLKKRYVVFLILLLFLVCGCSQDRKVILKGKIPVTDNLTLEIREYLSGQVMLLDTLPSGTFEVDLGKIPAAIYSVVFSWERNVLTPGELQKFARYDSDGLPRFFLDATCWLDASEASVYAVRWFLPYSQTELEENLLSGNENVFFQISSTGEANSLYNEYMQLIDSYKKKNYLEKNRIKHQYYRYNDMQDLGKAKELSVQYYLEWIPAIYQSLVQQEILFMQKHIENPLTAFIFCSQINTLQDFDRYKTVYEVFDEGTKTLINAKLAKLLKKK